MRMFTHSIICVCTVCVCVYILYVLYIYVCVCLCMYIYTVYIHILFFSFLICCLYGDINLVCCIFFLSPFFLFLFTDWSSRCYTMISLRDLFCLTFEMPWPTSFWPNVVLRSNFVVSVIWFMLSCVSVVNVSYLYYTYLLYIFWINCLTYIWTVTIPIIISLESG